MYTLNIGKWMCSSIYLCVMLSLDYLQLLGEYQLCWYNICGWQASYIGNMDNWGSGQNVVVWGMKHIDETWKRNEHGWLVGDGNKWKDGTSENSIYKRWVVVKGLKRGKYE